MHVLSIDHFTRSLCVPWPQTVLRLNGDYTNGALFTLNTEDHRNLTMKSILQVVLLSTCGVVA